MRLLEGSTWWWVGPWYILVVRFLEIVRLILINLRIVREFLINPQKPQSTNQFESQHRQILLLRILSEFSCFNWSVFWQRSAFGEKKSAFDG